MTRHALLDPTPSARDADHVSGHRDQGQDHSPAPNNDVIELLGPLRQITSAAAAKDEQVHCKTSSPKEVRHTCQVICLRQTLLAFAGVAAPEFIRNMPLPTCDMLHGQRTA